MTTTLTVEQILTGTTVGRMQSTGQMAVVPLLRSGGEESPFAPPELEASTTTYGTLHLRNLANRPTIVPPGAAWVTAEQAQDHTTGGGVLVRAGEKRTIDTASCIEQSQGGMIRGANEMLILPASLRAHALAQRNEQGFDKLWPEIRRFNGEYEITQSSGHLVYFLKQFGRELDQFVAEFELVPDQVGAIVLVAGRVAGVEVAPSTAYWERVWTPLIRVCYGSLALRASRLRSVPVTRKPLTVTVRSLEGLAQALEQAAEETATEVTTTVESLATKRLSAAPAEEQLAGHRLVTLASPQFAGQVVQTESGRTVYASLCSATA